MKTKLSIFRLVKQVLLLVFSVLGFQLSAQPGVGSQLTLTAEQTLVCGGGPVVLHATPQAMLEMQSPYYTYEYRLAGEGPAWHDAGSSATKEKIFVDVMSLEADFVEYRVEVKPRGFIMTSTVSNVVKITRDKSDACTKTCHQTSTGEYFMGTDFTPNNSTASKIDKPTIPDDIETFFNENNIDFSQLDKAKSDNYYITNDLSSYFDGQMPKLDTLAEQRGQSNYYYVVEDNINELKGFSYKFPCRVHHGSPYSYIMRAYLLKTKPNCGPSAAVKLETQHGNQTEDRALFKLYDEVTETMIKEGEIAVTYGSISLDVPDECVGHLIRMDVEFHGKFPEDLYNGLTGTYNGLENYILEPLLQQFDGCFKMAIDYISAEVASVCIGTGPYCVDKYIPVNAAGFPSTAELVWEYYDEATDSWLPEIDKDGNPLKGSAKTVYILVKKLGGVNYRVYDEKDSRELAAKAISFKITGSECDPAVNEIDGDENVCAPSRQLKYQVVPANETDKYRYDWTLTDEAGNKVNTDGIFSFASATTTGTLLVDMPQNMTPGKYNLSVQLMKRIDDDYVEVNNHTFTIPIVVYAQPTAQFSIKGGDEKLCPYAANVQFNAVDKDVAQHVFSWQNATPTADDVTIADITVPAGHCDQTYFDAGLIVYVNGFAACADTLMTQFEFNHTKPVIDCGKLGGDRVIFLDSISVDTMVSLPLPEVSATCDADPTIEIKFSGFGPDMKTQLAIEPIIAKYSQLAANPELLNKRIPFTAGKPGSVNGNNGITVSYVAKDGCAQPSDTCKFMITVHDTFPPRVDCSKIPNSSIIDSLSSYPHHQCVAIPGTGNPMYLPVLTAPSLEDTLHPGTFITGVFAGRSDGATGLNDPFAIGVTTIRWDFIDEAGNSTPCYQTVEVIDNSNPDVKCPAISEFVVEPDADGCVLSADGLIAQIKSQLKTDLPVATDYCQGDVELQPTYYYYDQDSTKWFPFVDTTVFVLNKHYTIQWRFYKQKGPSVDTTVYVFCEQGFIVIDNAEPKINCDTIPDPMIDYAIVGKCAIATKDFLNQYSPWPIAKLICSGDTIHGVLTLRDGSPLPDSIAVGDTVPVLWTFYNPVKSSAKATCEKNIFIRSSNDPIFDCNSLGLVVDTAAKGSCEVPIDHLLDLVKPWPTAIDSCTGRDIPGKVTSLDGNPLPEKLAVGDTLTMLWTFEDPNYTSGKKTCTQLATVIGDNQPIFDCNSLDTLSFVAHGTCAYVPGAGDIPTPVATDSCTGTPVPGKGTRDDKLGLLEPYKVGLTTLQWRFVSPYSVDTTKICEQPVWVKSDKKIETSCENKDSFPVLQIKLTNGKCSVNPEDVLSLLTDHYAQHPCLENYYIKGVPSRSDGFKLDSIYDVDTISIVWTFTDTTNTLVDPVSTCDQVLMITNANKPKVDCETSFPAIKLQMDTTNCGVDPADIPVYLESIPVNPCNGEIARVDTTRDSGKPMNAPFTLGVEYVTWKFTYPSTDSSTICIQKIEIIDTVPPYFDCSTLKDIDVELKDSASKGYPYADLVNEHGFYIPKAIDKCCEAVTTYQRSDGKALEENYPIKEGQNSTTTTITWIFTDCNGVYKTCKQNITVYDMIPPVVDCPNISDNSLKCLLDVPAPYKTYEEFKAAGGSVTPEDRAVISTFEVVEKYGEFSDSCNAVLWRTYRLVAINGDVVECKSPIVFEAHDDVAPEFVGIPAGGIVKTTSCSETDTIAPVVTAIDNCDPNPTLIMERISYQDPDPGVCGHYNYDVICTWWTSDRCGNAPAPVKFVAHVVDTVKPVVNLPTWWEKETFYALPVGNCQFAVPDYTDFPRDSIIQECGLNENLKIWQEPAPGTIITSNTILYLYIADVCGNTSLLAKEIVVQKLEDIIKIKHPDTAYVCGDDLTRVAEIYSNDLTNKNLCSSLGSYHDVIPGSHEYEAIPTTVLWDYYRDSIAFENLVYSANVKTYASLFDVLDENGNVVITKQRKYSGLYRRTQSDDYWFVAYDTVTGCTGSAKVYVDVRERPRIDVNSGVYPICESDSLPIEGVYGDKFPTCVDPMGGTLTYSGWYLNDTVYVRKSPVLIENGETQKAYFVATNECGTTTSLNTLFLNCGPEPENLADSLQLVGNSWDKLSLLIRDSLYTHDSVNVNLYTHYNPALVLLSTQPQNKARVWEGDDAMLIVTMPYNADLVSWRRVEGQYDGRGNAVYDNNGNVVIGGSYENDDVDLENEALLNRDSTNSGDGLNVDVVYYNRYKVESIADSARYYVVVGNGVCPAVSSNVVSIDVMKQLPTLITPYSRDGMNDEFMRGHRVSIFNRYGGLIFSGNNGWDGTSAGGLLVDPGVYFYEVEMAKGSYKVKGSVEVVKF